MRTITGQQQDAIGAYLRDRHISSGVRNGSCSIVAINVALGGRATDEIPACMSPVIGKWIMSVQDSMPDAMRNSPEWRELIPLAAGTGRDLEKERLRIVMDWMWGTVLPSLQALADKEGFGSVWRRMTTKRTYLSTVSPKAIAANVDCAARAAEVVRAAMTSSPENAAAFAGDTAAHVEGAFVTAAATEEAEAAVIDVAWKIFDPITLLGKLVNLD